MDDATFWSLIGRMDWRHEGDEDEVAAPAGRALARLSVEEIRGFEERMTEKLFALDGRAWARESGDAWWGDDNLSVDGFLYTRCGAVALGRAHYEAVLADPTRMIKNFWFEKLLYVAAEAFERKTGREADDELMVGQSYETFSNLAGWPDEQG